MLRFLLAFLLPMAATAPYCRAQSDYLVYRIERTPDASICELPILYFEPNSIAFDPATELDLRFLAHLMQKYRKLEVRLSPQSVPAEDDVAAQFLLEERLSFLVAYMEKAYGIKRTRFLRESIPDQPRGTETGNRAPTLLDIRTIHCQCSWK